MTTTMDNRRKRLVFRCQHMGTAENDIVFGGFAKAHIRELNDDQLRRLEALLRENDDDLYKWVMGIKPVPQQFDNDIMAMLKAFNI